ncbi:ABC transporter ATP-binding protein [Amycolatopsis solani]|uniref:ABC transporter ATP-binding protein n=1 Tax=Amycolatopsis solani TaxID=3028615 RepID=UPI0025AFC500|nr:ABC transporter ATP-binding protein [Amycolatopsis sp. MEP2-6]
MSDTPVLQVRNLHVDYATPAGPVHAVRGVDLDVHRGELVGIVGESGCGKSTLAYAITRLLRAPAHLTEGTVTFHGTDGPVAVTGLTGRALRRFRWERMSMVFQGAMNALNPVQRVAAQLHDVFRAHRPGMTKAERRTRIDELLELVGLPGRVARAYPHQLSGGMRQRVMIAMALALEPDVVVMDEPTTALDVLVQREILDAVAELRERLGFAVVFITHDLSLLLEISDRIAVMYAGRVVELADSKRLREEPRHPYSAGLLTAFPTLRSARQDRHGIPGHPPDLSRPVAGCAFAGRCGLVVPECTTTDVRLRPVDGSDVACLRAEVLR